MNNNYINSRYVFSDPSVKFFCIEIRFVKKRYLTGSEGFEPSIFALGGRCLLFRKDFFRKLIQTGPRAFIYKRF